MHQGIYLYILYKPEAVYRLSDLPHIQPKLLLIRLQAIITALKYKGTYKSPKELSCESRKYLLVTRKLHKHSCRKSKGILTGNNVLGLSSETLILDKINKCLSVLGDGGVSSIGQN